MSGVRGCALARGRSASNQAKAQARGATAKARKQASKASKASKADVQPKKTNLKKRTNAKSDKEASTQCSTVRKSVQRARLRLATVSSQFKKGKRAKLK